MSLGFLSDKLEEKSNECLNGPSKLIVIYGRSFMLISLNHSYRDLSTSSWPKFPLWVFVFFQSSINKQNYPSFKQKSFPF